MFASLWQFIKMVKIRTFLYKKKKIYLSISYFVVWYFENTNKFNCVVGIVTVETLICNLHQYVFQIMFLPSTYGLLNVPHLFRTKSNLLSNKILPMYMYI